MTSQRASQRSLPRRRGAALRRQRGGDDRLVRSMSAMGGMPMPGGWTMSMPWMRMPGQSWPAAAASFLGMWIVMMAAMMLPSLVPMLLALPPGRRRVGETAPRRG